MFWGLFLIVLLDDSCENWQCDYASLQHHKKKNNSAIWLGGGGEYKPISATSVAATRLWNSRVLCKHFPNWQHTGSIVLNYLNHTFVTNPALFSAKQKSSCLTQRGSLVSLVWNVSPNTRLPHPHTGLRQSKPPLIQCVLSPGPQYYKGAGPQ